MPETEYDGRPIRKHSLAVRGASGDALSGVLKVRPRDFPQGIPQYVLLEVMPGPVRFDPMDDGDAWELVNVTKVQRGTIIDEAIAKPLLDEVTVELEKLRVEETGQGRMIDESDPMVAAHVAGKHNKNHRKGCRLCNPISDEEIARADELAAKRAEHGDGEGDPEHPVPPARTRRTRRS